MRRIILGILISMFLTVSANAWSPVIIEDKDNDTADIVNGALRVSTIEVLVGTNQIVPVTTASVWLSATIGAGSTGVIITTPFDLYVSTTSGTSNYFSLNASGNSKKVACTTNTIWFQSRSGTGNNVELQGIQ